jgi:hypothetical protein
MATAARRRWRGRHPTPRRFRAVPWPHLTRAGEPMVPQLLFGWLVVLKLLGRMTALTRPTPKTEHPHSVGAPQLPAQATVPQSPIKVSLGTKVPGRMISPVVMVFVMAAPRC